MRLLAIERLDGACPVATMYALHGFSLVVTVHRLELGMRVQIRRPRHVDGVAPDGGPGAREMLLPVAMKLRMCGRLAAKCK